MSLCSLIYNDTQGISSANDLIQIMNIGNQFYSSLSQLTRQAFLMQSELPTALNVFDTDYQLEYSESYSGTVHQEIAIEGYQYCATLPRAFESLIFESYTNFILTVGCITVMVIWGSKYLILMLEINMVEGSLMHYFQSKHNNVNAQGFWYHFLHTALVVPLNPQKDRNICIPPCFIMKDTRPLFSTLKTYMEWLHLLMPLENY